MSWDDEWFSDEEEFLYFIDGLEPETRRVAPVPTWREFSADTSPWEAEAVSSAGIEDSDSPSKDFGC